MASKHTLLKVVQNTLAAVIIVGFGYYLWTHQEAFSSALQLDLGALVVLAGLVLAAWTVNATQNLLLYRAAGIELGFGEIWLLSAASAFGNYLPMRMGTVLRAHYLKAVHGLGYARFGAIFGVRTLLLVLSTALTGLVGTAGIYLSGGTLSLELLALFGGLFVVTALGWWVPLPSRWQTGSKRLSRALKEFTNGYRELKSKPGSSLAVLLLLVLQQVLVALRLAWIASVLHAAMAPFAALSMAPLAVLASYAQITPGALGIREAMLGYATFALDQSFAVGAYLGTVDRGVNLAVVAVVGGGCFLGVWMRVRKAPN